MPPDFPFPEDPEANGFRVFPDCLEDDAHVFFHGTSLEIAKKIEAEGFAPSASLASVSFAKNSSLALRYACAGRSEFSPDGCIIAVRYDDLQRKGLKLETSILHDYTLDPQPNIIGICRIPEYYKFI